MVVQKAQEKVIGHLARYQQLSRTKYTSETLYGGNIEPSNKTGSGSEGKYQKRSGSDTTTLIHLLSQKSFSSKQMKHILEDGDLLRNTAKA